MEVLENLVKYFDLGIVPEKPMLGGRRKKARAKQRFLWTILIYIGVFLGVVAEHMLDLYASESGLDFSSFDPSLALFALIIATLIFPQVFPKVFGKMKMEDAEIGDEPPSVRYVVQFCVAFQNGFFWQALIARIVQSMSG